MVVFVLGMGHVCGIWKTPRKIQLASVGFPVLCALLLTSSDMCFWLHTKRPPRRVLVEVALAPLPVCWGVSPPGIAPSPIAI